MADAESLTVTLPAELAKSLRDAVRAGEYPTLNAALADAVAGWADRHPSAEDELAWTKAKVQAAINDPRRPLSLAETNQHLDAFFQTMERRRGDEAA